MSGNQSESRTWDRLPEESPQAYAAFRAYRDLGEGRSFIATARALGRADSLVRRWATRHDWRARARAWDLVQARQDEAAIRLERDEALRRQLKDAQRMQQLAMAKLSGLVHRDPATGELALDPSVTPRDAVAIYRLGLDIQREAAPAAGPEGPPGAAQDDPYLLCDPEVQALFGLARERAGQQTSSKEETHDAEPQGE